MQSRDRLLFRLPPYVTVPLQHLLADVPRQGLDRLLGDGRIFRQPGDEGVSQIMPAVTDTRRLEGRTPGPLPRLHRLAERRSHNPVFPFHL